MMKDIYRRRGVWIKLCGLKRREDIDLALKLQLNALGFILAESPRQVSLDEVYYLTEGLPPFVSRVAVVSNLEAKELEKIIASRLFDYIQFHGDVDPELIRDLPIRSIKTISIGLEKGQEDLSSYLERYLARYQEADYFLFDSKGGGKMGGTGKSFDWALLKNINLEKPYILAGGLGPGNIIRALEQTGAGAVDLNSRVEEAPGIKNQELLLETVRKIKNYNPGRE